jgi:peptide/nickel transport system ATP-binding protein
MSAPPLLEVEGLSVTFPSRSGPVRAVRDIGFTLGRERLGIVGESGSGKSTAGRAILGLVPSPGRVTARRLALNGTNLLTLTARERRAIRGKQISMVMQDPKYSLNPVMKVGRQIAEAYLIHTAAGHAEARRKALDMMRAVRIRDPEIVYDLYPHQVSGGMGQRIMIAEMLVAEPDLLIADEPTSALDVTVQLQVLAIIDQLISGRGMGLIFISHNLNLVASFCDRILIMYGGRIVETCNAGALHEARHPYTRGLLAAMPRIADGNRRLPVMVRDPAWLGP